MAGGPGRFMLAFVTPREMNLKLTCSVDGDEIVGHLTDSAGQRRDFHGWLGLIVAIDAALTGEEDRMSDAA